MAKLLYIEASPRDDRSASVEIARLFLDAYASTHRDDDIERLDLWHEPLPEFDADGVDAHYAVMEGRDLTVDQHRAWTAITATANRFMAADKYLLGTPMWNFGVPYKLKHYIDVVTQPGLTFRASPGGGFTGLVTGKPIAIICSRGGAYPAGSEAEASDHQWRYLDTWLRSIGFADIHDIVVEPTTGAAESTRRVLAHAAARAKELARSF